MTEFLSEAGAPSFFSWLQRLHDAWPRCLRAESDYSQGVVNYQPQNVGCAVIATPRAAVYRSQVQLRL